MLPPTVATLRNCTPTMCRVHSLKIPLKYWFRPGWVSSCLRVHMHPIRNSWSVSSMVSSPRPDRSMITRFVTELIFSHAMPPTIRLLRFWQSS